MGHVCKFVTLYHVSHLQHTPVNIIEYPLRSSLNFLHFLSRFSSNIQHIQHIHLFLSLQYIVIAMSLSLTPEVYGSRARLNFGKSNQPQLERSWYLAESARLT